MAPSLVTPCKYKRVKDDEDSKVANACRAKMSWACPGVWWKDFFLLVWWPTVAKAWGRDFFLAIPTPGDPAYGGIPVFDYTSPYVYVMETRFSAIETGEKCVWESREQGFPCPLWLSGGGLRAWRSAVEGWRLCFFFCVAGPRTPSVLWRTQSRAHMLGSFASGRFCSSCHYSIGVNMFQGMISSAKCSPSSPQVFCAQLLKRYYIYCRRTSRSVAVDGDLESKGEQGRECGFYADICVSQEFWKSRSEITPPHVGGKERERCYM